MRVADDVIEIARRLKEIEAEKQAILAKPDETLATTGKATATMDASQIGYWFGRATE